MKINWISGETLSTGELVSRFNLPREEIPSFKKCMRIYRKGETIIREGESDKTLFLLRQGHVSVYKNTGPNERELISEIEAVNFFGEMSVIIDEPRTATIEVSTEHALVYAMGRPDLKNILTNSRWGDMLLSRLAQNLADTNDSLSASIKVTAQLKKEIFQIEAEYDQFRENHNKTLRNMSSAISGLIEYQKIIQKEAVVGSRGWTYLKALNDLTALLVYHYLPEITNLEGQTDYAVIRSCIDELGKKMPTSVYNYLLDSFPADQ